MHFAIYRSAPIFHQLFVQNTRTQVQPQSWNAPIPLLLLLLPPIHKKIRDPRPDDCWQKLSDATYPPVFRRDAYRIILYGLMRPDIRIRNGGRYRKITPQRFVFLKQTGILPVQFTVCADQQLVWRCQLPRWCFSSATRANSAQFCNQLRSVTATDWYRTSATPCFSFRWLPLSVWTLFPVIHAHHESKKSAGP